MSPVPSRTAGTTLAVGPPQCAGKRQMHADRPERRRWRGSEIHGGAPPGCRVRSVTRCLGGLTCPRGRPRERLVRRRWQDESVSAVATDAGTVERAGSHQPREIAGRGGRGGIGNAAVVPGAEAATEALRCHTEQAAQRFRPAWVQAVAQSSEHPRLFRRRPRGVRSSSGLRGSFRQTTAATG